MSGGLEELVPDAQDFLLRYWPNSPTVFRGPLDSFEKTITMSEFDSLEGVMEGYQDGISIWRDGHAEVNDHAEAWNAFHDEGASLYLPRIERFFPQLRSILRKLEVDLGAPPGCGYCNVFASPPGGGPTMHFDCDYGFNILIRGAKTWKFARNTTFSNPVVSFNSTQSIVPAALQPYQVGEVPRRMPASTWCEEIDAGDLVFIPRGWWHTTVAKSECIALDFAINPPTWLELILEQAHATLIGYDCLRRSVLVTAAEYRVDGRSMHEPAKTMESLTDNVAASDVDAVVAQLRELLRDSRHEFINRLQDRN